ncbi:MAG: hypothetical protein FWC94_01025 [Bacteroidales bacterium]|nr:hypothetical protein [Bacteroidales bacterium]
MNNRRREPMEVVQSAQTPQPALVAHSSPLGELYVPPYGRRVCYRHVTTGYTCGYADYALRARMSLIISNQSHQLT